MGRSAAEANRYRAPEPGPQLATAARARRRSFRHQGVARLALAALGLWLSHPSGSAAASSSVAFGRLTSEQGLSNNWVLAVLRDSQGFLWIGTEDGLNRYDGRSVRVYRPTAADEHSLPARVAGTLFEDSRHRLWIGGPRGNGGLALYDRERDKFVRFPHGPGPGQLGEQARAILEADEGRLWVATEKGVVLFDPEHGVRETLPVGAAEGRDSSARAISLERDRGGGIWVGTTAGLFVLDPLLKRCVPWRGFSANDAASLEHERIEALLSDGTGRLWVATLDDGLFCLDVVARRMTRYVPKANDPTSLSSLRVRCLAMDDHGQLWVGTENGGLNVFDPRTRRFRRYEAKPGADSQLGSGSIYALHSDRQQILWIGTYNDGLNYLSPSEQWFQRVTAGPGRLSDRHVSALLKDHRGNLWVGTDGGGLNRIDAGTGRFTYYRHSPSNPRSLGSDSVFALMEDRAGHIWVGGWDSGLARLDPRTGAIARFRHDPHDPRSIVGNHIWKVLELRTGELLVATHQGADLFDPRTSTFRRLSAVYPKTLAARRRPSPYPPAVSGLTYAVIEDRQGNLWLGAQDSVQRVSPATGAATLFEHRPNDPSSLADGMTFSIYQDHAGTLWFATEGGLQYLSPSSTGEGLTRVQGLPDTAVTNVLEDASGDLWVSTNQGLSRLRGAARHPSPEPSVVNFTVHDGLQAAEFARGAAFRDSEGRLYFGGPRGFNVFLPEAIRLNATPPPVVLTDFRVFNRRVVPAAPGSPLQQSITSCQRIDLSQDLSVLTFEFAALNLAIPQKNRYSYKLDGFDNDWSPASEQGTATYTGLRRGDYVFRVRAANNDGVWNNKGVALAIHVRPRWYERRLIQVPTVLLAAFGLFAGFRLRLRRLEAQRRDLERRVADRTAALNQLNLELEDRVASRTAELEEEKERLAVTLRSIGDAVIATDTASRVVLLNRVAEQLTGWGAADALGRPLRNVLPLLRAQGRTPLPDPVSAVLGGTDLWTLPDQALLLRRDGTEVLIADSAAPIRDRDSKTIGVVLVFRDVTERQRLEEQIQNAQKLEALGILAGGIAHDFNNLLTGVFGYIDLANRRCRDRPEQAVASLNKALAVLGKARGLTSQLLTFSRGGEPVTAPLVMGDLLRKCAEFDLSGSNVACEIDITPDLWPVRGDRRQIEQVVDNLLLNARQAMPTGGSIALRAENVNVTAEMHMPIEPARYVRLCVRDRGVGIAPEVLPRIFEPFFTTKAHGTGLGLATTYSIVRKHGGHVVVESEVGRGTTFWVYLPASDVPARGSGDAADGTVPGHGRVLVMDDEEHVRDVAREMLADLGYTVETVTNGDEAVTAYERARREGAPFDVAILDLTIPGGAGGAAVLARLRALSPGVQAIASSGYSGDPVMAEPEAHGFAARLTKPYTTVDVARVVRRVLAEGGASASGERAS